MHISVITIFPEIFSGFLSTSLIGSAIDRNLMKASIHNLRDYTGDEHRSVDDEPFGGGPGMVMSAIPWISAVNQIAESNPGWRILLSPQGTRLSEEKVGELATRGHLILLCGRYEGLDERVSDTVVDEEISIGDYVLSGGEVAAMVLIETVSRQIPGVIGQWQSVQQDSFRSGLLDYPHYTRPRKVDTLEVPDVLLSGDHRAIADWRFRESLRATLRKRPDLIASVKLTSQQRRILAQVEAEEGSPLEFSESPTESLLHQNTGRSSHESAPTE